MAFVQVIDRRVNTECTQGANAADAEHHLLVQAHLPATHVQDVGDRSVRFAVGADVCIEEQNRHATNLCNPYRRRNSAVAERNRDNELLAGRTCGAREGQQREVNLWVGVLLMPIGINGLAEVSAAIEESDADEWERHI